MKSRQFERFQTKQACIVPQRARVSPDKNISLPYPSNPSQLLYTQNRRPLVVVVVVGGARSEDVAEVLNGFESRAAPAGRPPLGIQVDAGVSAAAEAVVCIYNGAKAPVGVAVVVGGSWADTDEEPPVPICCRPWVGAASTWWTLH